MHSRKWNRCFEQLRIILAVPQNLELCLLSPRLEVVSCHANRAINRTAGRKLCTSFATSFAISLILSRYNSIRKTFPGQKYIGSDKQVQTTSIFSTCEQSILQQCSYAVLLIGVHFLFIYLFPYISSVSLLFVHTSLLQFPLLPSSYVIFHSSTPLRHSHTILSFYIFLSFLFLFFLHFCHYILHFLTLFFSVLMSLFIYHLYVLQHSFSCFISSSNYILVFLKFVVYVSVSSSPFLPPLSSTLIACDLPTQRSRYV